MISWNDLPANVQEFLVRIAFEGVKRGTQRTAEYLMAQLSELVGEPSARLSRDLAALELRLQDSAQLPTLTKLRARSAEDRRLIRIERFLNVVRKQMIAQNAFFYLYPSFSSDRAVMLLQTPRAYLSRDRFEEPAVFIAREEPRLKNTNKWKIEDSSPAVSGDFRGVRNQDLVFRHVNEGQLALYAPFASNSNLSKSAIIMNLALRLSGRPLDPWPMDIEGKVTPSVYKIGWDRIGLYSTYEPLESVDPMLLTQISVQAYKMDEVFAQLRDSVMIAGDVPFSVENLSGGTRRFIMPSSCWLLHV